LNRTDNSSPALAPIGAIVFLLAGMGTAVYELFLTPLRAGSHLIFVAIPLAIGTNIVLPRMARGINGSPILAASPVVGWVVTMVVLLTQRREGDVLLPAEPTDLMYAGYAVVFFGMLAGVVTVALTGERRGSGSGGAR